MSYLAWALFVDRKDEDVWRSKLGPEDIDAWCAAHGWKSSEIVSGSVNIFGYRDGHVEVTASAIERDAQGNYQVDPETNELKRRPIASLLARSVPEGIGTVVWL